MSGDESPIAPTSGPLAVGRLGGAPLCALICALMLVAGAARAGWDPPGWRPPPAQAAIQSTNPVVVPLLWALGAYRSTVSRVDGDRCPSYPSCSSYAVEALQKHGPVLGLVLAAGRLVSEADEAAFSPRIQVAGQWKVYAPVADDLAFLRGPLEP